MRAGVTVRIAALASAALLSLCGATSLAAPVTIKRDSYGVPHVYGDTHQAVSYGAGYALAQDRLWQMHVFRHVAKGRLSELLGPVVVDIDKTVRFMTYTEDERARRYETYPEQIRQDLEAFADGVNAWIAEVNSDPSKRPFEFQEFGIPQIPEWTVDDSVALQDVLILSFGSGGGDELRNAALLESLVSRLGDADGRKAFDDLVRTLDRDSPVTIPEELDWRRTPVHARGDEVAAVRGLEDDARLGLEGGSGSSSAEGGAAGASGGLLRGAASQLGLLGNARAAVRDLDSLDKGLKQLEAVFHFGSNAQIVGGRLAEQRNTLQTAGPQVGYLLPQWLADFGLHGGGLDATGMTFAGAGPAVLIGRGNGYAWTTTTGSSDLTDTYVVELNPDNPREYRFGGEWEPMDCRTETYTARGVPFEEQEICRTRHGPVLSFDEENDRAYAIRYAWFNREGQTIQGFFAYNNVKGIEDFGTAASFLASNHNMFYSDDSGQFGYWHPGNHVVRADGVDVRLPQPGDGSSEWQGLLPIQDVPHAANFRRGWLVNWNNQPAAGWERERAYSARDNVNDLESAYRDPSTTDPDGGRVNADGRWDFEDLNANLRHAAMKDHLESWYRSSLPAAEDLESELAREALGVVRGWDGYLVDRNGDGDYDSAGVTILREWIDTMRTKVFADDLPGDELSFARIDTELWHAISPDSTHPLEYDWLDGESPRAVAAAAFEEAVAKLAEEHGDEPPSEWRREAELEHYQRLNSDLATDLAAVSACDAAGSMFGRCSFASDDTGFPGDVRDHIQMDRGTFNHIVSYLDRPVRGPLGASAVESGSVIPPGQSGHVSPTGEEAPHFEDQLVLYEQWRYKPMPLTAAEVDGQAESTQTIEYAP